MRDLNAGNYKPIAVANIIVETLGREVAYETEALETLAMVIIAYAHSTGTPLPAIMADINGRLPRLARKLGVETTERGQMQ